jgi:hypothetical protein
MNLSLPTPRSNIKSTLLSASLMAAVIGLFAPAVVRADVIASVDKGQSSENKATAPAAANGSGSGGGKKGGGAPKAKVDSYSGSIYYTITVRNLLAQPAKATIEYHIYNKTTTSSPSGGSSSVEDITATSTLDLAGNEVKTIQTSDIPKGSTTTTSASSGGGGKKGGSSGGSGSSGGQTSTNTSVMGWVVYVKAGDKVIHIVKSTDSVLEDVAKIQGKSGG